MLVDLAAINRTGIDPGIVTDARLHTEGTVCRNFFLLVSYARSFLCFSPVLPLLGNEKRALCTGPMILDERYPFPLYRTKSRSHRNIVIVAAIPLITCSCRKSSYKVVTRSET